MIPCPWEICLVILLICSIVASINHVGDSSWYDITLMVLSSILVTEQLNSVKWFCSKEKCVLYPKFVRCHQKTNTIEFITLPSIKQAKVHLSSTIITEVSLFGYVIHSSSDTHCQQYVSDKEQIT